MRDSGKLKPHYNQIRISCENEIRVLKSFKQLKTGLAGFQKKKIKV